MKKKTDSTIFLPVWAQLLLPVLVTVLCAGIVLLCSIRPKWLSWQAAPLLPERAPTG